jgi:hypothetical protein
MADQLGKGIGYVVESFAALEERAQHRDVIGRRRSAGATTSPPSAPTRWNGRVDQVGR